MAAVPISVRKRLERKKESVQRRLQALEEARREAEAELAAIEEAQTALAEGRKPKLRDLLGEVKPSQKDLVLEAVRKKRSRGMTRAEIIEYLNTQKGLDISPGAVTTLLYNLRVAGLVEFKDEAWRLMT